ncbi:MAG: 1-(5-phosphoribosyl)-5-[(5-phosphoribosylamino)methylideneamino]imidazole-4-carboxamide isomerase [Clostridiales bacterium]|jgi:phosphoribosylformimino-5-aminoimidazole carboxamide ribotide isomerase|nr:1-(5-phosphoribosyl)-5-[(5-phosphoribosylamino)methylideneamino]imidazole-4-carboxamide isomerase [Clostridiales bacterium]
MILFPAIDILDGQAVRLRLGKRETATVYGSPVEFAKKWTSLGAEFLHIVDLNAAFDGNSVNDDVIMGIKESVGVPVQLGGGFRSKERLEYCLDKIGIDKAVIGSMAVTDPDFFYAAAKRYGERIVCGIDERDGKVSIKGWTKSGDITPAELCKTVRDAGVTTIVYTDISRDGALTGANVEKTCELRRISGLNIIASGGVASLEDIRALKEKSIYGAILGKSLYTGAIDLKEALKLTGKSK